MKSPNAQYWWHFVVTNGLIYIAFTLAAMLLTQLYKKAKYPGLILIIYATTFWVIIVFMVTMFLSTILSPYY